jgi:branched-chain amino acid transport system ATP-binding protein
MTALELVDLHAGRDGVPVVRGLSLTVGEGELVALMGPNGAGKSTTLLTVAGVLQPLTGSVRVFGSDVTALPTHKITQLGVALVPEDRAILHSLTVEENLRLRCRTRSRSAYDGVFGYFPQLMPLLSRKAGLLSGGEQQMLALACALATRPRLLMLDEMSLGLAPLIVDRLLDRVATIARETSMSVLIVEQHAQAALERVHRAYVLSQGVLAASGTPDELLHDADLLEATYLGGLRASRGDIDRS